MSSGRDESQRPRKAQRVENSSHGAATNDRSAARTFGGVPGGLPLLSLEECQRRLSALGADQVMSLGTPEARRPLERQAESLSVPQQTRCSHCQRTGHSLKDCLYGVEGFIPGCTFCNTQDHAVDTCRRFESLSLERKVQLLVHQRSNRPALRTTIDWWDYFRDYLKQGRSQVPEGFPWSSEFAVGKATQDRGLLILGLQIRWDENGNFEDLPVDPKHGSMDDVVRLYVGTHFWPSEPTEPRRA